jgi:hypothetical protein
MGLAIWHGLHAATALREWRRWRTSDPSLADFFLTELEIELAVAAVCLIAALLLLFVGRRCRPYRRFDEHAGPD